MKRIKVAEEQKNCNKDHRSNTHIDKINEENRKWGVIEKQKILKPDSNTYKENGGQRRPSGWRKRNERLEYNSDYAADMK